MFSQRNKMSFEEGKAQAKVNTTDLAPGNYAVPMKSEVNTDLSSSEAYDTLVLSYLVKF